jgi:hypothetical protein
MRHILLIGMIVGSVMSTTAMAGNWENPPAGDPCGKNANGKGLAKGATTLEGEFKKLLAIMTNRCSNSGGGNGGENQAVNPADGIYVFGPSETDDIDPGKSGGRNKAAK